MNTTSDSVLHFFVGKIGSGKSTLALNLAGAPNTILVSEDAWLSTLFGDQMHSVSDFVRCSAKLRSALKPHIVSLLSSGLSVVLDFQANTVPARQWVRGMFEEAGCAHRLHFLDVPEALCRERLHQRNASGEHPFSATDEEFDLITRHFAAPTDEEGFFVLRYDADGRQT